jgi:hypothetical protein
MAINLDTKLCSKCQIDLPRESFSKDKSRKDGLQRTCKNCYKLFVQANKDKIAFYRKCYRGIHKKENATYSKNYYQVHRKDILSYQKEYHESHKQKRALEEKKRYQVDLQFRLTKNLRSRLTGALKKVHKTGSAVSDLGCSIEELRKHLESLFYSNPITGESMSWDNWSRDGWHIDHIKPLASFDLANPEQLKKACHYENLQPLWAEENLKKSDNYGP